KIIITNLYHHHKSATTSYSVFLNVILSTTYDAGELLILRELLHLTKLWLRDSLRTTNAFVGRDQFIITRYPKKKLFNRSITNRESITVLEAVSANSFPINSKLITDKLDLYNLYNNNLSRPDTLSTTSQNTEFSTLKTAKKEFDSIQAIIGARYARYDVSRRHLQITGIINSSQVKEIKRKEYKLSKKADQEKTKRK
ncbi:hypothetical protein N7527_005652, partial [Penicillium freii]